MNWIGQTVHVLRLSQWHGRILKPDSVEPIDNMLLLHLCRVFTAVYLNTPCVTGGVAAVR
jgi:hypothetical protein